MAKIYFITGTDTNVGKTYVIEQLINGLRKKNIDVCGIKPIASGSKVDQVGDSYRGLVNSDALTIYHANDEQIPYHQVNPVVFPEAIAPHIAASNNHQNLSIESLNESVKIPDASIVLIEGAGGWLTPLNENETYADWVIDNDFEVILVVGMKLGCLNHAQLTLSSMQAAGVTVTGWIANEIDPQMKSYKENMNWLKENLNIPLLATMGYQQTFEDMKFSLSYL